MSIRATRLLSRFRWSVGIGVASWLSFGAVVIEPETQTQFNDVYDMMVFPGLKKTFPMTLMSLAYPVPEAKASLAYLRQRFISKQFAMGTYESDAVIIYRMVLLTDYSGTDLIQLIKPTMCEYSEHAKYHTAVDCTRTGSLFFEAVGTLKGLKKGDEITFLCNSETRNFTIWLTTQGDTDMHFTIESELLIDCVNFAFGRQDSPIFERTYGA
eukprot:73222_1